MSRGERGTTPRPATTHCIGKRRDARKTPRLDAAPRRPIRETASDSCSMRVFINTERRPDLSSRARSPGLSVRDEGHVLQTSRKCRRKRRLFSAVTLDAPSWQRKREIVHHYRLALNLNLSSGEKKRIDHLLGQIKSFPRKAMDVLSQAPIELYCIALPSCKIKKYN